MKEVFLPCGPYRIAVYESGSGGTPLVLLHGGGVDSAMLSWRQVMEAMAPTTVRTYCEVSSASCPNDRL